MAKKSSTDEMVMKLLVTVEKKKEEIKKAKKKPTWKTNCSIAADEDAEPHQRKNIQVLRTEQEVLNWYVFLMQKEEFGQRAASILGFEMELTWMGYPVEDWKEDLQSRAGQLTLDQKQAEMVALDKRVNKLVSQDQRREMELEALQQILG